MQNNNPHDLHPEPTWIPEPNYSRWNEMTLSLAVDTSAIQVATFKTVGRVSNLAHKTAKQQAEHQYQSWKCLSSVTDSLVEHESRFDRFEETADTQDKELRDVRSEAKASAKGLRSLEKRYQTDYKKLEKRINQIERTQSMDQQSRFRCLENALQDKTRSSWTCDPNSKRNQPNCVRHVPTTRN
jgi:hypothetical protein